jgi:hypothetical protein
VAHGRRLANWVNGGGKVSQTELLTQDELQVPLAAIDARTSAKPKRQQSLRMEACREIPHSNVRRAGKGFDHRTGHGIIEAHI